MTAPPPTLEIQESRLAGSVRLGLTGELDLGSAPILEDRLTRLRAVRSPVRLDLSRLEFIDSTGVHLLVRMLGEARAKHWELQIQQNVSPQVMRLLKLAHLEYLLAASEGDRRST